jgi:hypothetical protein
MSIAPAADIVHLWMDQGSPVRLVWAGHRYRTIGVKPIRAAVPHDALTHPAERLMGWSVIGRSERHPADIRVFQVHRHGSGWVLVDVDPA